MNKLATLSLAAAVLAPAGLAAQTVAPPVAQDVPPARLHVPRAPVAPVAPPAGVTWQQRAPVVAPAAPVRPLPAPPAAAVRMAPMPAPAPPMAMRQGRDRVIVRHGHGGHVGPGFIMPPFWMGPQFTVRDWRVHGFAAPARGQRWIRYYDDAVLVDEHGRVLDGRYGLDWDEYGERWGSDPRGIPVYVGDGDYRPDEDDYAYVEGYDDEGYAQAYDDGYGHADAAPYGDCQAPGGPGYYPPPPCGYGGYYPYGYGGVIITETTVTTTGGCCAEQVVVEERPRKVKRRYRPAPVAGERG